MKRRYTLAIVAVLYVLLLACEGSTTPSPTPPPLKDVYATAMTRSYELQTEVSK